MIKLYKELTKTMSREQFERNIGRVTYAVAFRYHYCGAFPSDIDNERFDDYDSALAYSKCFDEGLPTVYLVLDDKYVFYCARREDRNEPYVVSHIVSTDFGQIETTIWFENFIKDPDTFIQYASYEIEKE